MVTSLHLSSASIPSLLASVTGPEDLRALPPERLPELAAQLRSQLVEKVCATGGHLGPNLGVVESTVALHRVFDSPPASVCCSTSATRLTCTSC
ncbi:1-deoxy-D-xylulose-5-phosphate synthase N-terminal domain-containing protein [Streptomyces sp. CB02959]|uniref:1-deoxy-D-xylulose-5-phosphate synthase N-terminal domain-containing protein n=1 Tax=Streptomyces sp. CB02959 TaxID=2020330 RepID=UPI0021520D91|nr:1-deoxy-D-xylulose-5-phosphate synthase N-terminal domain-containing protein [Streptomyces sp. CB02959]